MHEHTAARGPQVLDPVTRARKPILLPCSGEAVPGEIFAIIGPSGAGARSAELMHARVALPHA
jgi:ABC-type cobalamin transport system ATPase subunit